MAGREREALRLFDFERGGESRHFVFAAGDAEVGALEGVADGLVAAAEIFGEEGFGDGVESEAVFGAGEAVAFVIEEGIGDWDFFGGRASTMGFTDPPST